MLSRLRSSFTLALVFSGFHLTIGCSSEQAGSSCTTGTERCPCYPNNTCNDGLACFSNRCVVPPSETGGTTSGLGGQTSASGGRSGSDSTGEAGAKEPTTSGGTTNGQAGATGEPELGGTSAGGSSSTNTTAGTTANGGSSSGGASNMTGGMSGNNLVGNGDFAQGEAHWKVESHNGGGISLSTNGQYCLKGQGALSFTIGYPKEGEPGLSLNDGRHYVFSFRARASAATDVDAKVGQMEAPYDAATSKSFSFGNSYQTYSQEFDYDAGLGVLGLAFTGSIGNNQELCLDDVTLAEKP
ncbi:MAG TPA: carbohydrate binding domain-containing protein [Polyangiaceae bacterium]|nr:carbohydrate binding domain-containing protein [Polyangiaceae bacterium]